MNITPMPKDRAEFLAIEAIAWLAEDPEKLGHFLGATGANVADLKNAAKSPDFLSFVMDFLMMDDQNIIAFAQHANIDPEDFMRARAALPGGDMPHWT